MKIKDVVFMVAIAGLAFASDPIFRVIVVLSMYGVLLKADDHKKILGIVKEQIKV